MPFHDLEEDIAEIFAESQWAYMDRARRLVAAGFSVSSPGIPKVLSGPAKAAHRARDAVRREARCEARLKAGETPKKIGPLMRRVAKRLGIDLSAPGWP